VEASVAYASHVGGFLTGFGIALVLAWRQVVVPTRYEQTLLECWGIQ
jgi:membrane associated rhomboid family serine protease